MVLSCRTALQPDDEDGLQGSVGAKISFGELFIPAEVERFDTRGELDRSQIRQTVVRQADGLDRSEGREIERSDLILLKSEALERRKGGEGRGRYLRAFDSQCAELRAFADLSLSDPLGMTDIKEAELRQSGELNGGRRRGFYMMKRQIAQVGEVLCGEIQVGELRMAGLEQVEIREAAQAHTALKCRVKGLDVEVRDSGKA